MIAPLHWELLGAAAMPYRAAGRFAWHFARSKLKRDPVFFAVLERGLIPDARRLLDLGCGQGLLASWLRSAHRQHAARRWPRGWPTPPAIGEILGLDLMPRDIERARRAASAHDSFEVGDIRRAEFGHAEVVVMLDVLHFLDPRDQIDVLRRVRDALPNRGVLLTRIGNAAGGLGFSLSTWVDRIVCFCRGHRLAKIHCRSTHDWQALLEGLGFRVEAIPMSGRTLFANVMLVAMADTAATP